MGTIIEATATAEGGSLGALGLADLSTWLGLSGIGACRGWVGWVSVV